MIFSVQALSLKFYCFEINDISSKAITLKIWDFTTKMMSILCGPATKYIQ
jgi:hypothetical protein